MPQLSNAIPGDRVAVYVEDVDGGVSLRVGLHSGSQVYTIPATVLGFTRGGSNVILGWKEGEVHPTDMNLISIVTLQDNWIKQGIVHARQYGSHCEFEPLTTSSNIKGRDDGNECPCGIHPSLCDYHRR